ncbi:hypothetical protein [Nocardia wallacei]|uniref:hypothetical protein n=1 Tax=Nocardia wallacei TaxID=480035 RepID=UPI00245852AC|nr:hypothetical protein [Nocardia wallacei]
MDIETPVRAGGVPGQRRSRTAELAAWLSTTRIGPVHHRVDPRRPGPLREQDRRRARRDRRTGRLPVAAVAAVAAIVSLVVLIRPDQEPSSIDATPVTSTASEPIGRPGDSTLVTGNAVGCGPGAVEAAAVLAGARPPMPAAGADAVAVFEAAYYHARDAQLAREVVAADSAIPPASEIQVGIDSVPAGTTYCARTRPLAAGLYAVEITEFRPSEPEITWRQRISTTQLLDGHTVITAITPE